jgi:hypothetical protein
MLSPREQHMYLHLQHIIFFLTYEWEREARVLCYSRLERHAKDQHTSFWGGFFAVNGSRLCGIA